MATLILFVWLNILFYTIFMTSCLRNLVCVCLAVISLTAFSQNILEHKTVVT